MSYVKEDLTDLKWVEKAVESLRDWYDRNKIPIYLANKDIHRLELFINEEYFGCQITESYPIAQVLHYGAVKYGGWGGWKTVPNAQERYWEAFLRHFKAVLEDENSVDSGSGLRHVYHAYVNLMFLDTLNEESKKPPA